MESKRLPWGSPAPPELTERYELGSVLGRGAMGAAVRAVQRSLDRSVVLKLMAIAPESAPALVARFEAEARILARISHPGVLPVVDFGVHRELAYVAYPDLGGTSLDRVLAARGRVAPDLAAAWLAQILDALDAVHGIGIVHRDLKPANVLLAEDQGLRLFDFGLARDLDRHTRWTHTGALVGTPLYMAPEQARGEAAEPADDLYAAGVLVYRAIAGSEPFQGGSLEEILDRQLGYDPPALHTVVPETSVGFSLLVQELMAKARRDRPPSAAAALRKLTGLEAAAGAPEDGAGSLEAGAPTLSLGGQAAGPRGAPPASRGKAASTGPGPVAGAWVVALLVALAGLAVPSGVGVEAERDRPGGPRDRALSPERGTVMAGLEDGVPGDVAGPRPVVSGWLARAVTRMRGTRDAQALREGLLAVARSLRAEPDTADLAAVMAVSWLDAAGLDTLVPQVARPLEVLFEGPLPGPAGALVEGAALAQLRRLRGGAGDLEAPERDRILTRLEAAMVPGLPTPWAGERVVAALDHILALDLAEGSRLDFAHLVELREGTLAALSPSARSRAGARLARAIDATGKPLAPGLAGLRARLFEGQVEDLVDVLTGPGTPAR